MRNLILKAVVMISIAAVAQSGCASRHHDPILYSIPADAYLSLTEPVTERVHVMRQAQPNFAGVVGNVVIIEQSRTVVLVDSGSSHGGGQRVVDAVRQITSKPVSAIIITHWHNDHPLGLSAIVEAWPNVAIISTERTRADLEAGRTNAPLAPDPAYDARRYETYRNAAEDFAGRAADASLSQAEREGWANAASAQAVRAADQPGTHVVLPNQMLLETLRLNDSHAPVEVSFAGRANTDGDAVIWLPRQRILVAGDIVVAPVPYMFNVYPADWSATLQRLRARDFAFLIPGHGEVQHDRGYLDQLIALIGDVRAQVSPLAQQGLTLEAATAQANFDAQVQRFAGDDPWLERWFRDYALTPLIDSVYREAIGEDLGPPPVASQ